MDMPQSHVVKSVKSGVIHLAHAAHHRLRAAVDRFPAIRRNILMGDQNITHRKIDVLFRQQPPDCRVVITDFFVFEFLGRQRRENIGHQPKCNRSVLIR